MILVKPIKIKALLIYPQRYGRSRASILKTQERRRGEEEQKKWNIIYYSCLSSKIILSQSFLFTSSQRRGNENVFFFSVLILNYDFVPSSIRNERRKLKKNEASSLFERITRWLIRRMKWENIFDESYLFLLKQQRAPRATNLKLPLLGDKTTFYSEGWIFGGWKIYEKFWINKCLDMLWAFASS